MTPEVLVVYQHLPHYRFGVFSALSNSRRRYVFAAGPYEGDGSILTIPSDALPSVKLVNIWFFRGRLLWQRGLLKLILRRPAAVIFLGDASYISSWCGGALCRLLGIPVFFWTIGWHRPDRGAKRLVRLCFYRLADELLLYGNWGRRFGEQSGYPSSRMRVIFNSSSEIPTAGDSNMQPRVRGLLSHVDSDVRLVICSVRLTAGKRLNELIQAVAILRTRGLKIEIVMIGEGPERENLSDLAVTSAVPVHFLGALYDPVVLGEVYARSSVCVIPARAGLTVLQSLRWGVPVVTHDDPTDQMPEFEAIQPGVNGGLFTPKDISGLAEQIAHWCSLDRGLVRERCRSSLEPHWTPKGQAAAIERCLTDNGVP